LSGPRTTLGHATPGSAFAAAPVNVNRAFLLAALMPLGVVTVTATVPGGCGGATASITLAETILYAAAGAAPNVTEVVPVKRLPEIVTVVPPAVGPLGGATAVIAGSAAGAT
jgi:hypothetical protein